jgi:hypothetical protein
MSRVRVLDLKLNNGHLLFMVYHCIKFEVCRAKVSQTFDILTSNSIGSMYYLRCISVWSLKSVMQRVLQILSGQFIPMSSLTFNQVYRGQLLSWCNCVESLKFVKQRVLKLLSGWYIHMSSLTLDLYTSKWIGFIYYLGCWLIDWLFTVLRPAQEYFTYMKTSPLPVKGCKSVSVCQTNGSQDIEQTIYSHFQC